ncbi:hypothetical protein SG34_011450 [Thalassomonas viridans]|uniref:DUF4426 domain-containing protein n=1 Tax=Thalassomonas viridans TaxID=137584 RepID=A0AAE9Z7J5_9GAMM|nr:hypothetical protein [Thalassomonas viridans]WDE07444.1 hypothetical protein SG34_011450 [Thalassomonas viridans]
MIKALIPLLAISSFASLAEGTEALTVDRSLSNQLHLSFPNDRNIKPKESDFKIINYVLMSNEQGERWSVITLTNTSSGNRMLEHHHLMALFADGQRRSPLEYKLHFEGNETQSITVSFGESKFPILNLYSSQDL